MRHRVIIMLFVLTAALTGSSTAQQGSEAFADHYTRARRAFEAFRLETARRELAAAIRALGGHETAEPRAAAAHRLLGQIDETLGRREQALAHTRRALALMESRLGREDPALVQVLIDTARLERTTQAPRRAADTLEHALAIADAQPKVDLDLRAWILGDRARALRQAGALKDAVPAIEAWFAALQKTRKPGHADLIQPLKDLAACHRTLRHWAETIRYERLWLARQEALRGEDDAGMAPGLERLSSALIEVGSLKEADETCRKWWRVIEKVRPRHPEMPRVMERRARIATLAKREEDAARHLEKAVALARVTPVARRFKPWGGAETRLGRLLVELAAAYRTTGAAEKALEAAEEGHRLLARYRGAASLSTVRAQLECGRSAQAAGQSERAEACYRAVVKAWEPAERERGDLLVEPLERLGRLLVASGRADEGRAALERAARLAAATKPVASTPDGR